MEITGTLNEFITNGEFTFDDIEMKAYPPNKTFNLTILTDSTPIYYPDFMLNITPNEENETGIYAFVIPVYLRSCVIGEIYETIYQGCYECEYSKYSLNTSDEICNPCPDNAVCYGGKNISLYPGYWRSSITSLNIVQCTPYADSCLYYDLKRLRYLLILIYIGENMKANAKSDMLDLYAKPVMFLDKQSINHLDCFNVHHVEMKA